MACSPGTYVTEELIRGGILQIGDGYRAKNSELGLAGLPFARAGNINNGFLFEGADCFPLDNIEKVGEKKSRAFDSVFTSKGTVGRIAYVKPNTQEFVYSPQLCYWRSLNSDVLDPRFLNYWMRGREFSNQVDYLKGQTDMTDYVSLRDQRKMTITIPPIGKQKKLATILGALDDRIELNRQTKQTLEQIAQAIFKSWFVDFEPVKVKQHIRSIKGNDEQTERAAQAVIAGAVNLDFITTATDLSVLDRQLTQTLGEKLAYQTEAQREQLATTAGHFPDQLVESELGLIPEGWEVSTIEALFELNPKRTLKKGQLAPYLEMKNMPTQGHLASEWTDREMGSGTRFMNGDALMARITPCLENGKTAFVDFLDDGVIGWGSTEYIVIRSKEPLPLAMAYLLARDEEFRSFAIQNMTGTSGRQRVNSKSLANYRMVRSNIPELYAQFGLQLEKIMAAIKINGDESRCLSKLRDLLLPKLLSGELIISGSLNKTERRAT